MRLDSVERFAARTGTRGHLPFPRPLRVLLVACCCLAAVGAAAAQHVIICGSGGEPEYQEKFADWGTRLRDALITQAQAAPEDVVLLYERGSGAEESTLENIRAAFARCAERDGSDSALFVYLVGHGTFQRGVSKLAIPGPDLSAAELGKLIASVPAQEVVVVNSASASAGFINALSAPGRIICTATKDVEEQNATEFMGNFVDVLEEGSADQNRDERISVLEACSQAATLTAAWYTSEEIIATEHALLDDNGDGLGTRLPIAPPEDTKEDGVRAAEIYIKGYDFPASVPRELVTAYQDALDAVEALKKKKAAMEEKAYYVELETLLVRAARANRALRQAANKDS